MFGELICGPPGVGKTTYCEGKRQFLSVYDPMRPVMLVNLDPANEGVFPYPCDVDVRELVRHAAVMDQEQLGPNGSYLFCAAVMEAEVQWLIERIQAAVESRIEEVLAAQTNVSSGTADLRPPYLLIDCPGQVEFYVNSSSLHTIFRAIQKQLQCSLCTVHLLDASVVTRDLPTYTAACLLALTTMIDHELPHVNVLTKWDMLSPEEMEDVEEGQSYLYASDFMTENFDRLWRRQLRRRRRHQRMAQYFVTTENPTPRLTAANRIEDEALDNINLAKDGGRIYHYTKALMGVIEGYGLVGYIPLDVQSQDMMLRVAQEVDNAVGNFM